jgi:isoquinoline 1-oxidoreductase beta subunit
LTFGIDMRVPGMLFASVARSPVHGGSVRRFSPERARAMNGVRHVVQIPSGVAVVATSTWEAMQGRDALEIEWDDGPNAAFDDDASWRMLEQALRAPGKVARSSGDARRRLATATRRIEAEYRWPWQAHAAIEPLNAVAHVKDGGCEIWAGAEPEQRPGARRRRAGDSAGTCRGQSDAAGRRIWKTHRERLYR